MNKIFMVLLLSLLTNLAAAMDEKKIVNLITEAAKKPPVVAAAPLPPGSADPAREERVQRLSQERAAATELRATCDGRFNIMRFDQRRAITRSETVSIFGGLFGVIGAVATCPHCAAIGAGLAGLANPLQQTFKDNGDDPGTHQAKLVSLSDNINNELDEYRKLPAADPDATDFEKNLQARLDSLLIATASCQYYEQQITKGKTL